MRTLLVLVFCGLLGMMGCKEQAKESSESPAAKASEPSSEASKPVTHELELMRNMQSKTKVPLAITFPGDWRIEQDEMSFNAYHPDVPASSPFNNLFLVLYDCDADMKPEDCVSKWMETLYFLDSLSSMKREELEDGRVWLTEQTKKGYFDARLFVPKPEGSWVATCGFIVPKDKKDFQKAYKTACESLVFR